MKYFLISHHSQLTLSGSVETLTASGERSASFITVRLGRSATHTALATPSAARAGSGGSTEEMMKTSVHLIKQLQQV